MEFPLLLELVKSGASPRMLATEGFTPREIRSARARAAIESADLDVNSHRIGVGGNMDTAAAGETALPSSQPPRNALEALSYGSAPGVSLEGVAGRYIDHGPASRCVT